MNDEEAAFETLARRRNVGATLKQVHENVMYRTSERNKKRARLILDGLEADGDLVNVGDKWFLTSSGYKRARGSAVAATWEPADAWLLLSALRCSASKQPDLTDLIASADYINRALPSHEEVHGAVNRLRSGRLLTTTRGKLMVTARAEALMKKAEANCKRTVLRQVDGLRRLLDCPCCGVELKRVRWGYELDAETYEASVKTYQEEFTGS